MVYVKKSSRVTLLPIGGGREIGANSYLVRANGHDVLLDCGVHPKREGIDSLPDFSLLERAPDAVIVSHGHVDHCGALPKLLKRFPSARPFATSATVDVMDRMLHNSVSVMTILARERNIVEYPLYTHEDVVSAVQQAWAMELDEEFALRDGATATARFYHAGHVLGSASVLLRLPGHTVFYTGDICTSDQELMGGLSPPDDSEQVDTLIIESTYGANVEADETSYEEQTDRFCAATNDVLERGGAVLVPTFALGRTQEMLNIVARLQDSGRLPDVPVYASGLGRAVYEVYHRYLDYLHPRAELQPLSRFKRLGDVWEPGVVQDLVGGRGIIVATSGMMIENTPSAMVAEQIVRHKRHGMFFVGYLDPDTLGYQVLHAETGARVRFARGRPPVEMRLENRRHFSFSAHAPRAALGEVIRRIDPKNVVFVHGDPQAIDWMYAETGNGYRKFRPTQGEAITLEA